MCIYGWSGYCCEMGRRYRQMNRDNYLMMKKEEKSTPVSTRARSVFRYELQATNEIFKDTQEIYPCSMHSTAHTNRLHHPLLEDFDQYLFDHSSPRHMHYDPPQINFKAISDPPYPSFPSPRLKNSTIIPSSRKHTGDIFVEDSPDSDYDSEPADCSHRKPSSYNDRSIETHQRRQTGAKQLRRQRRGLANISLKVKNIVARVGKMSFKEVSDEVLRQSQNDLPVEADEREKESKNIRRRVYDALNVLVSVGILGKEQRCVVHTQFTSVPGKKLSTHWQAITAKQRYLNDQQDNFNKKKNNLVLLTMKYQLVKLLHQRNSERIRSNQAPKKQDRYHFPLVFLIPPKEADCKVKVQIENDEKMPQIVRKYTIEGKAYVLTDLDLLKFFPNPPRP